jgi:methyl-accepting chemotaxis protein
MTVKKFILRVFILISMVVSTSAISIEVLFYQLKNPGWEEIIIILTVPLKYILLCIIVYWAWALYLSSPVIKLIRLMKEDKGIDPDIVIAAQNRAVNLPYFYAVCGFFYIVVCAVLITYLTIPSLEAWGWDNRDLWYALIGGVIAGLLGIPLYIYGSNWLTRPIIEISMKLSQGTGKSKIVGIFIPIRLKLIVTIFSLVGATTAYASTIGYIQSDKSGGWFFYLALWVVSVSLATLFAWAASIEIMRPLNALQDGAERIKDKQYTQPVELISNDELAGLGGAMNRMMDTIVIHIQTMEQVVYQLKEGVKRINSSVDTVFSISTEQATGATEQAAAVQESSSVAEEIVATAKQISERAGNVDKASNSTLEACKVGEERLIKAENAFSQIATQVSEISKAMSRLENEFQETFKVVEWMEDLADQTELLALNASLESAGAGVQGQRFGVVADATRRLSNRSADAAKEIRMLIESIQTVTIDSIRTAEGGEKKVEEGAQSIINVVDAFEDISSFAQSVSNTAHEITLSTSQQTSASTQLASSIGEVRTVALKVEDGAREIESAVSELRALAEELSLSIETESKS